MELRYFASVLWRFKVLFFVLTAVAFGTGVVLLNQGAQQYRSVATLLVRPSTLSVGGSPYVEPQRYVASQLRLLNGATFREQLVAADPEIDGVRFELLPQQNTDLVDIRATASTAEAAKRGANAFANQYLKSLSAATSESDTDEPAFVTDGITSTANELLAVQRQLARSPDDAGALARQQSLLAQYSDWLRTRTSLRLGRTLQVNTQILEKGPDGAPLAQRSPVVSIILLGFLGLLFASGVLVALSRLSTRVFSPSQLQEVLPDAPVVAFPRLRAIDSLKTIGVSTPLRLVSPMRQITQRVLTSNSASDTLTVAVVSLERESAVTTVAVLLAASLGRNGDRVVLADLNLSNQHLTNEFDARGGQGIGALTRRAQDRSDRIVKPSDVQPCLTETSIPGVAVVGSLGGVLNRAMLRQTKLILSIGHDVLVLDCAAVSESSLALQAAALSDVVVVVVPLRRTPMKAARELVGQLGHRRIVFVAVPSKLLKRIRERPDRVRVDPPAEGVPSKLLERIRERPL